MLTTRQTCRRHRISGALLGVAAVALLVPALAACGDSGDDAATGAGTAPTAADAWVRQTGDRGAVYLVITGGSADDELVRAAVPADIAATVELHETTTDAAGAGDAGSEQKIRDPETTLSPATGSDGATGEGMSGNTGGGDSGTTSNTDGGSGAGSFSTTDGSGASVPPTTAGSRGGSDSGGSDMGGADMGGGMMSMRQVERIEVPADASVELEPGGFHIMLLDVKGELRPGQRIPVTLTFSGAGDVTVEAEVRAA